LNTVHKTELAKVNKINQEVIKQNTDMIRVDNMKVGTEEEKKKTEIHMAKKSILRS
jgi:hypothetical protein